MSNPALDALRRNVSGKVATGEAVPIVGIPCFGWSSDGAPLSENARRMFARAVRAGRHSGDTGMPHGPVQWLQAAPPAAPARHESARLFTPVDVMRGQTGLDI